MVDAEAVWRVARAGGMTEPPVCSCHGEPQYWQKDNTMRAGGRWVCAVKSRARSLAWQAANPGRVLEAQRRRYHDPERSDVVLRRLMRQQAKYRRDRVRELTK